MPCQSMTGFGQAARSFETLYLKVELKAVNHRFSEFAFRIPREWQMLESDVRRVVSSSITRGRVEVLIAIDRTELSQEVRIDWGLLDSLRKAAHEATKRYPDVDVRDLMGAGWFSFPGVLTIETAALDVDRVRKDLVEVVNQAVKDLVAMRQSEGLRIERDLLHKLDTLERIIEQVEQRSAESEERARERLLDRLQRSGIDGVDPERALMEVVLYVDKTAIDEELVRLKSHVAQFRKSLSTDGPIGRRLDFIVQEMHREWNTIGSKASDLVISTSVVDAKVLVEQLREQVQNIE